MPMTPIPCSWAMGRISVWNELKLASRTLTGICSVSQGKPCGKHAAEDGRALVPGEADEADLALLFRLQHRLGRAAGGEDAIRVVGEGHLVDLPEIEVVGLQPAQALLQLDHRVGRRAVVGAVLGHQEDLVAVAILRQRVPHAPFRLVVGILPGVVHEGDAVVDGGVNDAGGLVLRRHAEVKAAETEHRNADPGRAQGSQGNATRSGARHGSCSSFDLAGDGEARFLADAVRVR